MLEKIFNTKRNIPVTIAFIIFGFLYYICDIAVVVLLVIQYRISSVNKIKTEKYRNMANLFAVTTFMISFITAVLLFFRQMPGSQQVVWQPIAVIYFLGSILNLIIYTLYFFIVNFPKKTKLWSIIVVSILIFANIFIRSVLPKLALKQDDWD